MVPVRAWVKSARDNAVMSAARVKPRAYKASITANSMLGRTGDGFSAGGPPPATSHSSLIVVSAETSQACAGWSPGSRSCAVPARTAAAGRTAPKSNESWEVAAPMGSNRGGVRQGIASAAAGEGTVVAVATLKNRWTARTKARMRAARYPACGGPVAAVPGAGAVNGGSHCGPPEVVKKAVHWAAVTCRSVSTVAVLGSQAVIWSASMTGGAVLNVSTVPVVMGAVVGVLSVTVTVVWPASAAALRTVVPAAIPGPATGMPG